MFINGIHSISSFCLEKISAFARLIAFRVQAVVVGTVAAGLLLGGGFSAWAQAAPQEKIQSFDVTAQVNMDASAWITEQITFDVTGEQIKRGIIRELPLQGVESYQVKSVLRNGRPEPYTVEANSRGIEIIIGNRNRVLSPGRHQYEIVYRAEQAVRFQKDFDELYWNVTGNRWAFPIEKASFRLVLPPGAQLVPGGISLYTGKLGAQESDAKAQGELLFRITRPLAVGEGFTVSAAWNKGIIQEGAFWVKWLRATGLPLRQARQIGWAWLGLLCYYLFIWGLFGRDPKKNVLRRLEPPEGLSPAQVRYLRHMQYDTAMFSVTVMSLAQKGCLRVTENKRVFSLHKTSVKPPAPLSAEEQHFLDTLFAGSRTVSIDSAYFDRIQQAHQELKTALQSWENGRYFSRHNWANLPTLLFILWLGGVLLRQSRLSSEDANLLIMGAFFGVFMYRILRNFLQTLCPALFQPKRFFVLLVVLLVWGMSDWKVALSVGILLLPGIVFDSLVRAYTAKGREYMNQIEGFAQYMQIAEEQRVFQSDPTDASRIYCSYLPYAAALDMQSRWRAAFENELGEAAAQQAENAYGLSFSRQITWFNTGVDTLQNSYSSTGGGSGFSGFGGGGFSGGGSGGGGGRGW